MTEEGIVVFYHLLDKGEQRWKGFTFLQFLRVQSEQCEAHPEQYFVTFVKQTVQDSQWSLKDKGIKKLALIQRRAEIYPNLLYPKACTK